MTRTVLIVDDHPLFRDALKVAVSQALPGVQINEADSVDSLFAALDNNSDLELLLLDLNMPGAHGFSALVQARAHYPTVPVIVISAQDEASIGARALAHGAAGFVSKSAPITTLVEALRSVLQGGIWSTDHTGHQFNSHGALDQVETDAATRVALLTPQQFRVLGMLSAGLLNKQIATALNVSEATVKAHMTAVMQKLGARNRTQAVLMAQRLTLEQP
jgi:DNA-binding NarL/FixJ family response regulator